MIHVHEILQVDVVVDLVDSAVFHNVHCLVGGAQLSRLDAIEVLAQLGIDAPG